MKQKKLVIDIEEDLHFVIKHRALNNRLTIKDWILIAIANQIKLEDDLNRVTTGKE